MGREGKECFERTTVDLGSRGGLFTRSGSVAIPFIAEWLSAIANAENRGCHSV